MRDGFGFCRLFGCLLRRKLGGYCALFDGFRQRFRGTRFHRLGAGTGAGGFGLAAGGPVIGEGDRDGFLLRRYHAGNGIQCMEEGGKNDGVHGERGPHRLQAGPPLLTMYHI